MNQTNQMKAIKATYIDTARHGYLSVSKKDFIKAGLDPAKITGSSGHTFTRLYLEEDCDGSYFMANTRDKGIQVNVKTSYNEKFHITNNYKPELFNFIPQAGQEITIHGQDSYTILEVKENGFTVRNSNGARFWIPGSNPFRYVTSVIV